jgi:flagellar biosynthesis protein FlhF
MRLRRFEAATVTEALARVRADLGPEAMILHAKCAETPGGGAAARVEVMAAVDEVPRPRAAGSEPRGREPRGLDAPPAAPHQAARAAGWAEAIQAPAGEGAVEQRLEEMYRMLRELGGETERAAGVSAEMRPLYRRLCRQEVPARVARRLVRELPAGAARSGRDAEVGLQAGLANAFRVSSLLPPARGRRVLALVGPTGVGKTTSLAKLAGQMCRATGQRPALMSLDTYRIGAIAQMEIYAELLGVPLTVVRRPAELSRALAETDADLVLLDTVGRSPRHAEGIGALQGFLRGIEGLEVHLVVSATTKGTDLEAVLARFRPLRYRRLLITKLDEATTAGPVLAAAIEHDLPVSYLTTGQEVPDDLEAATSRRLAGLLLPAGPRGRREPMGG